MLARHSEGHLLDLSPLHLCERRAGIHRVTVGAPTLSCQSRIRECMRTGWLASENSVFGTHSSRPSKSMAIIDDQWLAQGAELGTYSSRPLGSS